MNISAWYIINTRLSFLSWRRWADVWPWWHHHWYWEDRCWLVERHMSWTHWYLPSKLRRTTGMNFTTILLQQFKYSRHKFQFKAFLHNYLFCIIIFFFFFLEGVRTNYFFHRESFFGWVLKGQTLLIVIELGTLVRDYSVKVLLW